MTMVYGRMSPVYCTHQYQIFVEVPSAVVQWRRWWRCRAFPLADVAERRMVAVH